MTEREALAVLRKIVARYPSQTAAAASLKLTKQYLHDILHGRRKLSDRVLAKLGLARDVRIVEAK